MKSKILIIVIVLVSLIAAYAISNNTNKSLTVTETFSQNIASNSKDLIPSDSLSLADEKVNVLPIFKILNGDGAPIPSKDFSTGHIEQNRDDIEIELTEYGYIAHLPAENHMPSPAVYDGVVYLSGGFGSMEYYAIEASSGKRKWGITLDDDGPSSPAIKDDIMVFNTESCTIFACDVETGEHIWSYWMGDPLMSMPTIAGDIVYSAYPAYYDNTYYSEQSLDTTGIYPTHVLIAFDLYSGEILWQKWIDGDVMSAPVAKREALYVATFPGTLLKLDQKTGEFFSAKAIRATSAPVIEENEEIYITRRSDAKDEVVSESVSSMDLMSVSKTKDYKKKSAPYLDKEVQEVAEYKSEAMSMDANNGFSGGAPSTSGWEKASSNIGYSNVSSLQQYQGARTLNYDGKLYNTLGNEMVVTNASTGKEEWRMSLGGEMNKEGGFMGTPPIQVGGFIIVADFEGRITVSDANSGDLLKEYETKQTIRSQPVVMDGWIYASTVNGKLIAIDTKMNQLTGWPTWGGNCSRTNSPELQ